MWSRGHTSIDGDARCARCDARLRAIVLCRGPTRCDVDVTSVKKREVCGIGATVVSRESNRRVRREKKTLRGLRFLRFLLWRGREIPDPFAFARQPHG